jgi:hypothetical protein
MDARHHRADGDLQDSGDLLVGEVLHVPEHHGAAEALREPVEGAQHLLLTAGELVLGGRHPGALVDELHGLG